MSLVAFRAQNHPQQVKLSVARDAVDDRATSPEVFMRLNERFAFTVDVAAAAHNAKLSRYYDRADDGLSQSWDGERVWCNPPYSDIRPWIAKAWSETSAQLVVMILPANRTEQSWWQDLVEPMRDREGSPLRTEFIRGRVRFMKPGEESIEPNNRPPFGCVLLIWDNAQ